MVGNISTFSNYSKSSCRPDVSSSLISSRVPDVFSSSIHSSVPDVSSSSINSRVPDVFCSSIRSSVPDVFNISSRSSVRDVQDVTEPSRHHLTERVDAVNDKIKQQIVVNDDGLSHEIISMIETRESDESTMILLQGNVNGYNARVLIDCGASHNFISENFVKCHDLPTNRITPVSVTVANGRTSYINQVFEGFELALDDFNDRIISAYVFPIQSDANYDLILGLPWLFRINPSIDWKTRCITITAHDRKYIIKPANSHKQIKKNHVADTNTNVDNFLINAKQLSRCRQFYLVTIKSIYNCCMTSATPTNKQINQLLEEFDDLFPDDLTQLPPKRDIDHEIKLIDNAIPPAQQPFRMSQPELAELKRQLEILLEKGYIRSSKSPYAAPVLFAKKKDGTLRTYDGEYEFVAK